MPIVSPQIKQGKKNRQSFIDYLASLIPTGNMPNPPGMEYATPSTWQGAGRSILDFLIPQPEDTLMGVGMPRFYRGINIGSTERIKSPFANGKLFVTPDINAAKNYGDTILTYETLPGAKILVEGSKEFNKLYGRNIPKYTDITTTLRKNEFLPEILDDIVKKASDKGYHAVQFKRNSDIGTVVLDNNYFKLVED